MSIADELAKLDDLRRSGALSDDEFDAAKRRLLSQGRTEQDSLGRAANRYVSFQMIAGVVGLIIFLILVFTIFVPMFDKVNNTVPPTNPGNFPPVQISKIP